MMDRNEEAGRANNNPYAHAIYRRFVLPLAQIIDEDLQSKGPGRRKAHVALLRPLNPEATAFLAVRNTLNMLMNGERSTGDDFGAPATARAVVQQIGKACYHELCLSLFEYEEPELFHTLVNDLDRRLSKSERHRMTVFRMQAEQNGVTVPEWGQAGVNQIGSYLVDQLEQLGMIATGMTSTSRTGKKKDVRNSVNIRFTEETLELIATIKGHIVETTPYYLPCVERPIPWTAVNEGGWHTPEMRRMQPYALRVHSLSDAVRDADLSIPLAAINKLQSVAWQINSKMLDTIKLVSKHFDMEEILANADFPPPDKPHWLVGDIKSEDMEPEQKEEFIKWKREKAEWFTQMKLRGTRYGRFYTATTVAEKFREYGSIYFVYFADFRGRLYVQTTGVSPQGSDMQKALLRFSAGKPLGSLEAERWFCIHGANKWGYDKASLDDRVAWCDEHHDRLMAMAADPIGNNDWRDCDKPLQFLAWCFEYAEWRTNPDTFVSHIPVGMDGSCNGLQNFSAMLRDEVGGRATNLVPALLPNDIYAMVAEVTSGKLQAVSLDLSRLEGDELTLARRGEEFRSLWLKHGINRTLVKRSVMTLPYGSTRFSCSDFIVADYLKAGKAVEFAKEDYTKAAQYLSHFVWDGIGEVVVKAREAMAWLQRSSKVILASGVDTIEWTTPSGFKVVQSYNEQESHRIRTNLCGNAFLRISHELDNPDRNRHRNGIAPNFIHSYDSSHLHLVSVANQDIDLAMIHDDYGTHAADCQQLYVSIRREFIDMYTNCDPLQELADRYVLDPPPEKGTLDLEQVMDSPYFFS